MVAPAFSHFAVLFRFQFGDGVTQVAAFGFHHTVAEGREDVQVENVVFTLQHFGVQAGDIVVSDLRATVDELLEQVCRGPEHDEFVLGHDIDDVLAPGLGVLQDGVDGTFADG